MENKKKERRIFGLLGRNIAYSFSRAYFSEKFKVLKLSTYKYINFDINELSKLQSVIEEYQERLVGFNVTIPYKQDIFKHLNVIHPKAKAIGAVNTVKLLSDGSMEGYNTDEYGFRKSLEPLLKKSHNKALILGTGGASKAVAYALESLHISFKFVTRNKIDDTMFSYEDLNAAVLKTYTILINCTPLGTFPNVNMAPIIPYEFITSQHLCYDLIYNPKETLFLKKAKLRGAIIKNGLEMLELQADKAWEIWQSS